MSSTGSSNVYKYALHNFAEVIEVMSSGGALLLWICRLVYCICMANMLSKKSISTRSKWILPSYSTSILFGGFCAESQENPKRITRRLWKQNPAGLQQIHEAGTKGQSKNTLSPQKALKYHHTLLPLIYYSTATAICCMLVIWVICLGYKITYFQIKVWGVKTNSMVY